MNSEEVMKIFANGENQPMKGETNMKKSRIGLVTVSLLLICAMAVQLVGCSTEIHAENLMEDITPNSVVSGS